MSGSALGVGLLGVICAVACGVAPVAGALAVHQRLQGAADGAALAAADAASGRVPADACVLAAQIAVALDAELHECIVEADGSATVRLQTSVVGLPIAAWARAGPPTAAGRSVS